MRTTYSLSLLLLLLLLAGCDRTTRPESFDPSGSLSFTYAGAVSGSYQTTGELDLQPDGALRSASGARALRRDGMLALVAFRDEAAQRGDFFALLLGDLRAPGTVGLDPLACQQQDPAGCRIGALALQVDPAELDASGDLPAQLTELGERTYLILLGSVTVTSLTDLRVRGTFQGSGFRGGTPDLQNLITISGGTFDLPIQPE